MNRSLLLCGLLLCVTYATTSAADFDRTVGGFLKAHCVDCHTGAEAEYGVRLDRLVEADYRAADSPLWTRIDEQLRTGAMPPPDSEPPPQSEIAAVRSAIASAQHDHRDAGTRRLNRRELNAALQHLAGLAVDHSTRLPEDGLTAGFDSGADALTDGTDAVLKFLDVTRLVTDSLIFTESATEPAWAVDFRTPNAFPSDKEFRALWNEWKAGGLMMKERRVERPGVGLLIEPKWLGDRGGIKFAMLQETPPSGVLRVTLTVSKWHGDFTTLPDPHLWVSAGGRVLDRVPVTSDSDAPQELTFDVQTDGLPLEKGHLVLALNAKVEVPYAVKGFPNDTSKVKPEENVPERLFRPLWDRKAKLKPEEIPAPYVALHAITLTPRFQAQWPQSIGVTLDEPPADDDASARELLRLWTSRAYRRPVEDSELDCSFAIYRTLRAEGETFDDALRGAFRVVLMSGGFRYLVAPSDAEEKYRQYAIASRLAFFLTGAPPDETLLDLAARNRLRDPQELDRQVDRLTHSAAADGFFTPFVSQWLEMHQPLTLYMEHHRQQDFRFGHNLKRSLRRESIEYVAELVRQNRPASELVRSDFAMLNDVLAWYYGYDGVTGHELRPVRLRKDDPRATGGLLGHAGLQAMLTWMGDNWVIYRGAWTLRALLDTPPPPAPLEVPELDPSAGENRGLSFRELLKQHQEDTRCSVCHKAMDPLGFAFQNFDPSGLWRTSEFDAYKIEGLDGKLSWNGTGKPRPVDAAGQLPRGEEFRSFDEATKLMATHYERDLARGLLRRWLLVATGRIPDTHDLAELRAILDSHETSGYRLGNLLKAIVSSDAFLDP